MDGDAIMVLLLEEFLYGSCSLLTVPCFYNAFSLEPYLKDKHSVVDFNTEPFMVSQRDKQETGSTV